MSNELALKVGDDKNGYVELDIDSHNLISRGLKFNDGGCSSAIVNLSLNNYDNLCTLLSDYRVIEHFEQLRNEKS